MRSKVIVYTGNGCGKTTASMGVALRAIAHGKKVVVIQFMKGWKNTGEYLARDFLPNYEIHQFGRETFVNLRNPEREDVERAKKALEFARKKLQEKPFLMILDEINIAVHANLISEEEVIDLIKGKPDETNIILTGRYASSKIIQLADIVTEMVEIKRKDSESIEGIEY